MHPLHEKALTLAKTYRTTESELLDTLMQMQGTKLFVAMGYSGIYNYCTQALKLSEAQACYFSKVARKSVEVPALKQAIEEGVLTLSQARRIEPVITKANSDDWIGKAAVLPQRELERAVTEVNPRAVCPERVKPLTPQRSEIRMTVSVELERQLREVQDLVSQKTARPATLEDALTHLTKLYLERHNPVRKAERAVNKKPSSRKPATPKVGRQRLPAGLKHQVHLRDGYRCTHQVNLAQRCSNRRWLHLHHVVPVAFGGRNELSNLVTLCSLHHQHHHWLEQRGSGSVRATQNVSKKPVRGAGAAAGVR